MSCGTGQSTETISANLASVALLITDTTVIAVSFEVDTLVITIAESFGTFCKEAFTLGAVVTACTVFDFCSEFITAAGIEDTYLILAGKIFRVRHTLPRVFLALVGRAVRHTLFIFAFFELTAHFPVFALTPNRAILTNLHTLGTDLCAFRGTSSAFT